MLKYVESVNSNKKIIAGEAKKIMDIWKESGLLILDEIDVLTHPLKSELNFPIGQMEPIEMFNDRWDLPILLLSCWSRHHNSKLKNVIEEGLNSFRVQQDPHLVLLDLSWYQEIVVPLLIDVAMSWLMSSTSTLSPSKTIHVQSSLRRKIQDERSVIDDEIKDDIFLRKRIVLCANWIRVFLPHCISKIHRVSYGLLHDDDDDTATKLSLSRRLMAVPFLGKDVPSRSSEFAHADIAIGLTILAFRYHGFRTHDVTDLLKQLKRDFNRENGVRDQKPSFVLFERWRRSGIGKNSILPLDLFRYQDSTQISMLLHVIGHNFHAISYYLSVRVFPRTFFFVLLCFVALSYNF